MDAQRNVSPQDLGALELKKSLGRNLLRGFAASVFVHASLVSLVAWMVPQKAIEDKETVIILTPAPPRTTPGPKIGIARPRIPDAPVINIPVPVVPEIDTASIVLKEPDSGITPIIGIDTNIVDSGLAGGNVPVVNAGFQNPWEIWEPREIEPSALDINPKPDYPEFAKRAGVEGTVQVWVHVDAEGNVQEYSIGSVNPKGLGFEKEVLKIIPKWKFTPAIQQNQPVAVWISVPFKFRMK